jgi:hypothetical protein
MAIPFFNREDEQKRLRRGRELTVRREAVSRSLKGRR